MRYLLVMLLLLAGCTQPVAPSPSSSSSSTTTSAAPPTPTPSPVCSPTGGTPRACSPEEVEKTEKQNRLTEEAIALYRRWTKESTRLYRAGGTDKPTKEMLATTAGEFQGSVLGIFQDIKSAHIRAVAGEIIIVSIGPHSGTAPAAGSTGIVACMDSRSLKFERGGKPIRDGILFKEYVVAKLIKEELRLWDVSSEVVKSC